MVWDTETEHTLKRLVDVAVHNSSISHLAPEAFCRQVSQMLSTASHGGRNGSPVPLDVVLDLQNKIVLSYYHDSDAANNNKDK